jgi:hypothetical protein
MSAPVNWTVGQRAVGRWAEPYCRAHSVNDVYWRGGTVQEVLEKHCVMTFGKYSNSDQMIMRKFKKEEMVETSKDIPQQFKHEEVSEYADIVDIASYKAEKAKKEREEIIQQREIRLKKNQEVMMKKIETMKVSTKVNHPETNEEIRLSKPKSRKERNFKNIPYSNVIEIEKVVETQCFSNGYKLSEKELEKKVVQLTYIKNGVGSFAGPFDRPLTMPVRLGKESLNLKEYTEYTHDPEEEHFEYVVDEEVWNSSNTTSAMDSLKPVRIKEESYISGPCQERKGKTGQIFYTCKEGKCRIPCVCAVCNADKCGIEFKCLKHTEVNPTTSGFNPLTHLMTVRNDDSYTVTDCLDLDEMDGNRYCLDGSCKETVRMKNGDRASINERSEDKENLKKCLKDCTCPTCPLCKTVQVIKFTEIPKDCEECKQELYDHEAHHEIVHEGCKFCDYIIVETDHFEIKDDYEFWHHNKITRKKLDTVCHMCEKIFTKVDNLREHQKNIHHKNVQLKIKCERCDFSTIYKRSLFHHRNTKHVHSKSKLKCTHCKYSTYLKRDLNIHTEIVHQTSLKFKCDYCKYKASHKKILHNHITTVHKNIKEFQCDYCPFFSYYANNLKTHVTRSHTQLSCNICPFKCKKKTELNAHIRKTHDKKPELKCEHNDCDWKTTEKKELTKHKKRKHM